MRTLLGTTLLFLQICAVAWAQGGANAQIHGTVQDASGSAVPGAEIKAIQTETGISRTASSKADGGYVLTNLPLGPYQLEITKEGFSKYVQSGIVLQVNSDPLIEAVLKVGSVSEQVIVEANVSQVETRSAGVGTVVETQRILDLPLNGRQPTDLITLSGAAVQLFTSASNSMNTGVGVSVAGGNGAGVQYNLDGAEHLNFFDGTNDPLPFPDALQEFKISTSAQDSSSSGKSGAVVNAVTRSGSNVFHGDLFEFLRNYDLNARDFFATRRDGLKRNQFGGVLGGPIKKDKLFFFLGDQSTFVRQVPIATQTFIPTSQMLEGDFSTFASPQCQGHQVTLKSPAGSPYSFVNNQISPAALSPAALKISARLPQALNDCGLYLTGNPLSDDNYQIASRVDYQLSDKQSLFGRYMFVKDIAAIPYTLAPGNVLTANGSGSNDEFNSVTLGDTYLLSSTVVNAFRLSFNRVSSSKPGADAFGPADVGISMYTYLPHYMPISATGAFSLGTVAAGFGFTDTTGFGANDDFTIIRGSHQITVGGSFTRAIEWHVGNAFAGGSFTVGSTTGLGLSDFMLGLVAQFRQANSNPINLNQNFFALYATDTWKVTPRLTLTYGVNWAPFFSMSFPQRDIYNFSLGSFYAGQRSTLIPTAPSGFTFPGDPGFPASSGVNSQLGYFDPRVGLAWDPFGDGKTAIRMGAGIAHDYTPWDIFLNEESALPFRANVVTTSVKLDNPYPNGDPFPYSYNPANPVYPSPAAIPCLASSCPAAFLPIPANFKTDEQYSWNFGVQRQVTPNWFASATYLGTHILHLLNAVELNPAIYVQGNCVAGQYGLTAPGPCTQSSNITQRRVLNLASPGTPPLANITTYDDGGTQGYNGLLLTTRWRMAQQFTVNANYTWSHCIGLPIPSLTSALNPGANYVHQGYGQNIGPANRDLDVGDCVQDRRQVANLTLVYQTPGFSNKMARLMATGWTLASTFVVRSGAPLTVLTSTVTDPATGFGGTTSTQRPNLLQADTSSLTRGQACSTATFCESWLNPAAFAAPALGTFGNLGVGSILGPGFWQWDQAVSREFRIREGQTLVARFEMFNVTNSFRPGNPGTTLGTSTFGVITADATPPSATSAPYRVLQFAMKYVF